MRGHVSVELLEADKAHEGIVARYIYYPRAKTPEPILVAGTRSDVRFELHEYLPDGTISGNINFLLEEGPGAAGIEYGVWTNPRTGDTFSLETLKNSTSTLPRGLRPTWWAGDPFEVPQERDMEGYKF